MPLNLLFDKAVWNYPRSTRGINLLIGVASTEIDALVATLQAAGFRSKHVPPLVSVGSLRMIQFLYTPPGEFYDVQFDLLLAESLLEKSAISRRVARHLPGVKGPLEVLQCDDLILLKLISARLIDRADAAMLLRENRATIDFSYLKTWVDRLELENDFAAIWREACPGETFPLNVRHK